MESEGPYAYIRGLIVGPTPAIGSSIPFHPSPNHLVDALNEAYAKGRKAAEKEFRELLELANRLVAPAGPKFQAVTDFKSWKKARGIE